MGQLVADSVDWLDRGILILGIASWLIAAAVTQIHRRRVREFFGGKFIRIVLPLRLLGGRRVVSEPDFLAASTLRLFLEKSKIDVEYSFVDPDGFVALNEGGTIVICGPKSSPIVAEAMATDPHLHFEKDDDHWHIRDSVNNKSFTSLMDSTGEKCDCAYIARSVRREGAAHTFISIAGIHAEGSAIASDFLASRRRIGRLQRKTKGQLFSLAISGEFTTDPLEIVSFHELAFYHRPDTGTTPPRGVIRSLPEPTE